MVPFAGIDFESAGDLPGFTDVPVQIGMAWLGPDPTCPTPQNLFRSYLKTERPVTWQASRVHGIRTGDLMNAPALTDLWPAVNDRLTGRVIVAHQSSTEKRFLRHFPLHPFGPWVDTLDIARKLYPGLGDYSLSGLCEDFGVTESVRVLCPDWNFHDACFDAVASLALLGAMVESAGISEMPLRVLLDLTRA